MTFKRKLGLALVAMGGVLAARRVARSYMDGGAPFKLQTGIMAWARNLNAWREALRDPFNLHDEDQVELGGKRLTFHGHACQGSVARDSDVRRYGQADK